MRFLILLSLVCLSFSSELDSYKDFLVIAAKNHYKSVSDYGRAVGVTQLDTEWEDFKTKFNRKYSSVEEEEERKFNFLKALQFIESHNKLYKSGLTSHHVDINEFADWSRTDYEYRVNTNPMNVSQMLDNTIEESEPVVYAALPPVFDWRKQNKVTPVKNQGQCGSCYAFSAIATIESAWAIRHNGQFVSLSEQQIVDCSGKNGCVGGWMTQALGYVQANGIEYETEYPYRMKLQSCMNSPTRTHFKISGYRTLPHPATDEQIMSAIMNNGPVAVNIDASGNDFGLYRGGILSTGNTNLNHYVTAVGWGPGYWIVKNSWGTTWGEAGFARMARGRNIRGFNQYLFYPVL